MSRIKVRKALRQKRQQIANLTDVGLKHIQLCFKKPTSVLFYKKTDEEIVRR